MKRRKGKLRKSKKAKQTTVMIAVKGIAATKTVVETEEVDALKEDKTVRSVVNEYTIETYLKRTNSGKEKSSKMHPVLPFNSSTGQIPTDVHDIIMFIKLGRDPHIG